MANKFQKSVLERLEQDAARQKQLTKKQNKASAEKSAATHIPDEPPAALPNKKTDAAVADEVQTHNINNHELTDSDTAVIPGASTGLHSVIQQGSPDISEYIRISPTRLAKNKTFYLDSDVINAIKVTAQKQSVTDSKLVNDILRKVLGLE